MTKQIEQRFTFSAFGKMLFESRWQTPMYGLALIIVSFNTCFFLQASRQTSASETMINAIQLGCFIVIGIVNVWLLQQRNFLSALSMPAAKQAFICLLSILIALVLFLYYFISGNHALAMAFASSSAFLLPFVFHRAWIVFAGIPEKKFPVWHRPNGAVAAASATISPTANSMQVQLQLSRRVGEVAMNTFPVTVSGRIRLGRVFERFLEEHAIADGKIVEDTRDENNRYGWQFFEQKWGGLYSRYLTPSLSLLENKLKANALIRINRVHENQ